MTNPLTVSDALNVFDASLTLSYENITILGEVAMLDRDRDHRIDRGKRAASDSDLAGGYPGERFRGPRAEEISGPHLRLVGPLVTGRHHHMIEPRLEHLAPLWLDDETNLPLKLEVKPSRGVGHTVVETYRDWALDPDLPDETFAPGDWVIIHMGFVVDKTDKAGADEAMAGLELLGRGRDEQGAGAPPAGGRYV